MAFVLWYSGVRRLGASRAGLFTGVAPVAAAAAGLLLGAPLPRPLVWAGMAVVGPGPATVTVSVTYRGQTATGTFVIDVQ